jgi:uncharacterized protein YukE
MANRVRNSKQSIQNARDRFQSCADAVASWWKDDAAELFCAGKNTTISYAGELTNNMNILEERLRILADQVKRAEDEKRAERLRV